MSALSIESQVRDILNSRLALGAQTQASSDSSETTKVFDGEEQPTIQFVNGDALIVRNTFVQMRSHKNEHQAVFDAGLRLRVVGVDNMGNICVNTVDNRWKQEKWITTRNFFNLQKKQTAIKMTRSASMRTHSRSLTFDASGTPMNRTYQLEDMRTPRSPDFGNSHSRHRTIDVNQAFATPARHQQNNAHHRRTMSNKDELRDRIRMAIERRESRDLAQDPDFNPNSLVDPRSRSRTQDEFSSHEHSNFDRKKMPPKIKTPSNPSLDRVRQRDDARTPEVVERSSIPPSGIACPTPRNAWADVASTVNSFSQARQVQRSSSSISSFDDIPDKPKPKTTPSKRRKSSVVFCDCDGVLNTAYTPVGEDGLPLDSILVARVARLCKESRANLVLTSTWREDQVAYGKLFRTFQKAGVTVLGRTPSQGSRSSEVLSWLRHNQRHVRNWVILDDRMELFTEKYDIICPHLVLIDEDEGVTDQDVDYAKTILNPNPVPTVRRKRIGATAI